ncbi:MAG: asparagine synthase-related protein [Coxiellaceae bacterium]|nr:asparagine synthase-related protein [Coxiellaceae bacterium]
MSSTVEHQTDQVTSTVNMLYLDARIDNRQQLIYELRLSKFASDQDILLAAYEKWQTDCTRHLLGDFAFVLFDKRHQAYLLGRDPIGCRPLFYYHHAGQFAFANNIPTLLSELTETPATNMQWVADNLTHTIIMTTQYTDQTYYKNVYRVTPGHSLVIAGDKKRSNAYWDLNTTSELMLNDDREYIDAFKEQLTRAVYRRVKQADRLGSELSGGLDSSSVAVIAKQYQPDLHAFSNVPHPDDPEGHKTDERQFSRAVAEFAHIRHLHETDGTQGCDAERDLRLATEWCGMPCEGVFPVVAMPSYRTAEKAGVHLMLSGFGGDQCVTMQGAGRLKDITRAHRWAELLAELKYKHKTSASLYTAFMKRWIGECVPGYQYLRSRHQQDYVELADFALSKSLLDQVELPKRFPLLKTIRMKKDYNLREWQRQFFIGPDCWHVRVRVECSAVLSSHFGLQYAYPLLDTELLQFVISLPARIKYQQGTARYLIRQAMQGMLPESLLTRFDKTGGTAPGASYVLKEYQKKHPTLHTPYADTSTRLDKWEGIDRRQWDFVKMMQSMTKS